MTGKPTDNEQHLLQQVAAGQEAAFRELVAGYADLLHAYLYRHIADRQLTEEIVQDIFLKVWLTRETLSEIRNFRTYLFVVARNYALNELKKLIRLRQRHRSWEQAILREGMPEEGGLLEERLDIINAAIDQLPPQQQRVWILSRREGLSHAEIAAQMGISRETVKKYMQYAVASIRHFIERRIPVLLLLSMLKEF